ncbi:hypothetical protein [Streptomyces sp. S.PNR 29]|uniref:hypothetical protein n=1 Tax=Streptomyces sp. S.PNR 29 TaxID=2973805 RepID=UPI0025AF63B8|nr:hypothetical protein [Streptomyces sp. S.PNR 29]MDN0200383.1 hypothetical protein [Streptomyces sp. S.PNR 29]
MSATDAMTLPEAEAPRQPPPRRRTPALSVLATLLGPLGVLQSASAAAPHEGGWKVADAEAVKDKHPDPVDAMIRVHTKQTSLVKRGDLAVVSACHSLDTGRVEVLTGAPSA